MPICASKTASERQAVCRGRFRPFLRAERNNKKLIDTSFGKQFAEIGLVEETKIQNITPNNLIQNAFIGLMLEISDMILKLKNILIGLPLKNVSKMEESLLMKD